MYIVPKLKQLSVSDQSQPIKTMKAKYIKKIKAILASIQNDLAAIRDERIEILFPLCRENKAKTGIWVYPAFAHNDERFSHAVVAQNAKFKRLGKHQARLNARLAAVKSGEQAAPAVRKPITFVRVAKTPAEKEALKLANQEMRLGKLNVWSEAYHWATKELQVARMNFVKTFGVDDLSIYNAMELQAR